MRLVSFRHAGAAKFGVMAEGGIVDLSARLASRWPSLRAAIAAKSQRPVYPTPRDVTPG